MKIKKIDTLTRGHRLYLEDDNANEKILHILDEDGEFYHGQCLVCVKYSSYDGEWFLIPGNYSADSLRILADYLESNNLFVFYQDLDDMEKLVDEDDIINNGYYEAIEEYGNSMGWVHETINDFWFDIFDAKDINSVDFDEMWL